MRLIDADMLIKAIRAGKIKGIAGPIERTQVVMAIVGLPEVRMPILKWNAVNKDDPDSFPKDMNMKLTTCRTRKGELILKNAYYVDGEWHATGKMPEVIAWAEVEPFRPEE